MSFGLNSWVTCASAFDQSLLPVASTMRRPLSAAWLRNAALGKPAVALQTCTSAPREPTTMLMMLLLGDDDELMMTAFLVRASSPRATSTSALSSHLRSLRHASSERDALAYSPCLSVSLDASRPKPEPRLRDSPSSGPRPGHRSRALESSCSARPPPAHVMDHVPERRQLAVHGLAHVRGKRVKQRLIGFQLGMQFSLHHLPTGMVLVDDLGHIGSQAHCHGGTVLACFSHEAEVACVVVDDNLEVGHVGRHYGQKPAPLAQRLCANELVDVRNNSRRTDCCQESRRAGGRADVRVCLLVRGAFGGSARAVRAPRCHETLFFAALLASSALLSKLQAASPARSCARVSPDAKIRSQCILGDLARGLPSRSATCQLHLQGAPRILWPVQHSAQAVLAHGLVRRRRVGHEHSGMLAAHSPLPLRPMWAPSQEVLIQLGAMNHVRERHTVGSAVQFRVAVDGENVCAVSRQPDLLQAPAKHQRVVPMPALLHKGLTAGPSPSRPRSRGPLPGISSTGGAAPKWS